MCSSNSVSAYEYVSIIYKFYFVHVYLIIVTIGAHYERKDIIKKQIFIFKKCLRHVES